MKSEKKKKKHKKENHHLEKSKLKRAMECTEINQTESSKPIDNP